LNRWIKGKVQLFTDNININIVSNEPRSSFL